MIVKERIIHEFVELVQIDSETRHEQEISNVLKKKFGALGLTVKEDDSRERSGHGAGNLIMTWEANGAAQAPHIYFTSHMDTVVPGKGVKPQLGDDGWIRSDGTTVLGADDKAGLAAMLEAIRVVQEQGIAHGRVQFVITVGEESKLAGARAMNPDDMDADFGYAVDASGAVGSICVAAPTLVGIEMKITGKSADAGINPEDGISAIQVASKAISAMKLGRIDKETTANIGRFEGGGSTNIVCDVVHLFAEARSIVPEKVDHQVQHMREALETTCREFDAQAEFRSEIIYPGFSFTEQDKVVKFAQRAIAKTGLTSATFISGDGSDANIFNGFGIPTVNIAVGYEQIHTTQERIQAENLVKLAELIVAIIREVAEAPPA